MIVNIFLILIAIEFFLFLIFMNLRKIFPWSLTSKSLYPKFDEKKFKRFKEKRYDTFLGWDHKRNSIISDFIINKKIFYKINNYGQRRTVSFKKKIFIASFGDSYVFCRQIKDEHTWQEVISKNNKFRISNYGVGNFGFDQSILKYKRTILDKNTKFVIQGFVPETISRIQSVWKHFLEFGNIHGFKPMFILSKKKLKFIKNPLNDKIKINNLHKLIKKIRETDRFYSEKFKKNIIQFPYSYHFFVNASFNLSLLKNYIFLSFINLFKKKKIQINEILFSLVVKKNLQNAHLLYKENYSKNLLSKLIDKFIYEAKKREHIPIIIIFPQLIDLKLKNTNLYYRNFFKSFEKKLKIIDLTCELEKKNLKKMFINDKYGGHLSKSGNNYVANIINIKINRIIKEFNAKNL